MNDGEYEIAAENYTIALGLHPDEILFYELRGDAYKAMGEDEKAEADFQQYRTLKRNLGKPRAAPPRTPAAKPAAKKAVEKKPTAKKPVAEKSIAKKPATKKPVAKKPAKKGNS